ncbi:MAG: hypothetical protein GWN18_12360 [Thermoplasmata archaeon]|nr:hypothetical protein [Thermoplasmata archaeon]NIS12848.1 hypothetical protein [Thermoplasmata archaeon]NIV79515.1 hypothetical protein [Thermoplasmata archaeon]NIW83325.1 hypothetical protein [Thermoplasmata archaeon]NIW89568.1 hypothetical protein [Thermoplasmata archaeon]
MTFAALTHKPGVISPPSANRALSSQSTRWTSPVPSLSSTLATFCGMPCLVNSRTEMIRATKPRTTVVLPGRTLSREGMRTSERPLTSTTMRAASSSENSPPERETISSTSASNSSLSIWSATRL